MVIVSAPGKLILFGEHAVVYGKTAIATSLCDLRATIELIPLNEKIIKIEGECIGIKNIEFEVPTNININSNLNEPTINLEILNEIKMNTINNISINACIYFFLMTNEISKYKLNGALFKLKTDIPVGAGLGSSAAFSVCLISSLFLQHKLIQNINDEIYLNLINDWSFQIEKLIHGIPSGIDNSCSTFGGILKFKNKSISFLKEKPNISILIIDTKISRNTKNLVNKVKENLKKNEKEMNLKIDLIESCSLKCLNLFENEKDLNNLNIELEKLIDKNHELLNEIGVGHQSLDDICNISSSFGFHSKLTGAGGGGCAYKKKLMI
eukprot:gene11142-3964_t